MRRQGLLLAVLLMAACRPEAPPAPGAAGATPAAPPPDPALARGQLLALACQACHSFDRGGKQLVGPNLYGVFGRRAGTAAGFDNYSPALKASGIVWTPEELDRWLADPTGFLPGTTMGFTGYQSAADRRDLIAYLRAVTGASATGADPPETAGSPD